MQDTTVQAPAERAPALPPNDAAMPTETPTQAPAELAIRADDFSFWYGGTRALNDISLDIPEKQVTALIGPSGCGKSTFLRSINRMNDLIPGIRHDGDITLRGESVYRTGLDVVHLRKRVGMVFQKSNPFPKSIYENVAYGARVNGLAKGRRALDELVEHSLKQAARVSDYTAFFYMGSLVEMGRTNTLFTNPREERTEAYITGRFG